MNLEMRQPTLSEYQQLRASVGWWKTDDAATKTALDNSLFSIVAIEKDEVVGLGRIVGDDGLYFYVQDLIVAPKFQNQGVGRQMLNELMRVLKDHAKPGAFVGLMSAKGFEEYYKDFGFVSRDTDAPGMFQLL